MFMFACAWKPIRGWLSCEWFVGDSHLKLQQETPQDTLVKQRAIFLLWPVKRWTVPTILGNLI